MKMSSNAWSCCSSAEATLSTEHPWRHRPCLSESSNGRVACSSMEALDYNLDLDYRDMKIEIASLEIDRAGSIDHGPQL
jgi:hypothetical protein